MADKDDETLARLKGKQHEFKLGPPVVKKHHEMPKKSGKVATAQNQSEIDALHVKIGRILGTYNGMESHIPLGHEYWGLLNQLRGLLSPR